MTKKIINSNITIAKFMGYKKDFYDHGVNGKEIIYTKYIRKDPGHYKTPFEFSYHSDWNELIPVVCKCLSDDLLRSWARSERFEEQITINDFRNIKTVYGLVVVFIKWYNKEIEN